jgi:hypothetical protein
MTILDYLLGISAVLNMLIAMVYLAKDDVGRSNNHIGWAILGLLALSL